jgi:hypothetical protein
MQGMYCWGHEYVYFVCLFVCVCLYIYIYIYIYTYTHTYIHTHKGMDEALHSRADVCRALEKRLWEVKSAEELVELHTYIHIHTHIHAQASTRHYNPAQMYAAHLRSACGRSKVQKNWSNWADLLLRLRFPGTRFRYSGVKNCRLFGSRYIRVAWGRRSYPSGVYV